MVGDLYKLKVDCLGNPRGTIGIVFYDYFDGQEIIFPNGNYDGFNHESEIPQFLDYVGHIEEYSAYKFKNVMKVSQDFDDKYWDFNRITNFQ